MSGDHEDAPEMPTQTVATKTGDEISESPRKRRKVNITAEQKQGLIDDLQIESKCSMYWCASGVMHFKLTMTTQLPAELENCVRNTTCRSRTYARG